MSAAQASTVARSSRGAAGRLPDFVIAGAMRSGTTSLAIHMGAHPELFMARQKEVHFFDRHFGRGLGWYRRQFADVPAGVVAGEATPTYLSNPLAMARMAEAIPRARLIAILRNPVDRAYSHYWMLRAMGLEERTFEQAVEAELGRSQENGGRRDLYLRPGRYLRDLLTASSYFSRESIFVMIFEDFRDSTADAYAAACRFLCVDGSFRPPELRRVINRYAEFRSTRIRRLFDHRSRGIIRRAVDRLNTRRRVTYPAMDASLRAELLANFEADNAGLERWLGRDLSAWQR